MKRILSTGVLSGSLCLFGLGITPAKALETIDVLGLYSSHAASLVSDPRALFVSNIEYANRALANSNANYRYNLVHVQQQDWAQDSGLGGAQLQSFAQDSAVQALREQYGADFVAGIVPQNNGLCGIGYLPQSRDGQTIESYSRRYAYSLSGHSCGGRTMAHELGHNAGLGHSAAQNSSGTLGTWARGHGEQQRFVTIMAYNSAYSVNTSAGRIQVHSNPNINICDGRPCGVERSQANGADAVRALNIASPQFASYTESKDGGPGTPVNLAPKAVNDTATTKEDEAVTFNVLSNDSDPDNDPINLASVSSPTNGTASVASTSGNVRYVPKAGFFGTDRFTYQVQDSKGASATGQVVVTVTEVDDGGPTPPSGDLVENGDVENGLTGWQGVWGTRLSRTSTGAIDGYSASARGGYGVAVDLQTPITGGQTFDFSAAVKPTRNNRVYAYLRIQQNGRWTYRYISGVYARANRVTTIKRAFSLPSGEVTDGYVLFYLAGGAKGNVLLDSVKLTAK
ncbi:MAG: cadherin-like domain-containing protein [Gammaproteobacteria bacterium]|nr:cadherin-like domain-containing protein [Gammaproteobacteria bacterium]